MAQVRATKGDGFMKYTDRLIVVLTTAIKDKIPQKWGGKTNDYYIIADISANKKMIEKYQDDSYSLGRKVLAYKILATNGKSISIGSFHKPHIVLTADNKTELRIGNKGNISEGVLSAAMFARFVNKGKKITLKDVKDVLNKYRGSDKVNNSSRLINVSEKSANENDKIFDVVNMVIALPDLDMLSLMNKDFWDKQLKQVFADAILYANSKYVIKWADMLYFNNQLNKIDVLGDGLSDNTGTKADIIVFVDGKAVDLNISLKATDVKQFGQVGGDVFKKMQVFWARLGVDIKPLEANYIKSTEKDRKITTKSFNIIYKYVIQKFNTKEVKMTNLISFIKHNATKYDSGIKIVQLNKGVTIYDFKRLDKYKRRKVTATMKYSGDGNNTPTIVFSMMFEKKLLPFLQIRMRYEVKNQYPRTLVEKLPGLAVLISDHI